MNTAQKEELKRLKGEANSPKSALLRLAHQIEQISPIQAEQLRRLVGRLGEWQWK